MIRRDCAYCIDLDEQGALCDHPCALSGGEPVEISGCSPRCDLYEERLSGPEMRSRIHDLEAELRKTKGWLDRYSGQIVPLRVENEMLRDLVRDMYTECAEPWATSIRRCGSSG